MFVYSFFFILFFLFFFFFLLCFLCNLRIYSVWHFTMPIFFCFGCYCFCWTATVIFIAVPVCDYFIYLCLYLFIKKKETTWVRQCVCISNKKSQTIKNNDKNLCTTKHNQHDQAWSIDDSWDCLGNHQSHANQRDNLGKFLNCHLFWSKCHSRIKKQSYYHIAGLLYIFISIQNTETGSDYMTINKQYHICSYPWFM